MTYQTSSPHYDTADADESSSLVPPVVDASSSFSLGQHGVSSKKNRVPTMRVMIVTCFLLGTLAMLYGGRGSSNTDTNHADGTSEALLLRHNQAAPVYDPSQAFCFKDRDNDDKYCWYSTDNFPVGNWEGFTCAGGHGCAQCGPKCTSVYPSGQTSGLAPDGKTSVISGPVLWFRALHIL